MRISISVRVTRIWVPPSHMATATTSTTSSASDNTGHQSRTRRITSESLIGGTSYALHQGLGRDQPGRPIEQHQDHDGEDEGVAERAQLLRQVGLEHHRHEADGEAAD